MALSEDLKQELQTIVQSNPVVLFMKGTRGRPQCGFSASVVDTLNGLLDDYRTVNVLERADVREGIKEFSSWPTIPQLYVRGEFIGGADIVGGLAAKGELAPLLGVTVVEPTPPAIEVSPSAAAQFREALADAEPGQGLRFEVDRQFRYGLNIEAPRPTDLKVQLDGFALYVDRASAKRAEGTRIDFVDRGGEAGFKISNPQEPPKVRGMTSRELKQRLDAGEPLHLFDVRTDAEIQLARIAAAQVLDEAGDGRILSLPKDTVLVFQCHHGQRSLAAAEHYLGLGYTQVYNLVGGIEAWSREIDPSVPRY